MQLPNARILVATFTPLVTLMMLHAVGCSSTSTVFSGASPDSGSGVDGGANQGDARTTDGAANQDGQAAAGPCSPPVWAHTFSTTYTGDPLKDIATRIFATATGDAESVY